MFHMVLETFPIISTLCYGLVSASSQRDSEDALPLEERQRGDDVLEGLPPDGVLDLHRLEVVENHLRGATSMSARARAWLPARVQHSRPGRGGPESRRPRWLALHLSAASRFRESPNLAVGLFASSANSRCLEPGPQRPLAAWPHAEFKYIL